VPIIVSDKRKTTLEACQALAVAFVAPYRLPTRVFGFRAVLSAD
jgi:hypothetical protein